jgi:hypothetical protein
MSYQGRPLPRLSLVDVPGQPFQLVDAFQPWYEFYTALTIIGVLGSG